MKLKKKLSITFLLQSLGVSATALTKIIIAQRYGPEGQGYFSYYYSLVNLLSGIGLFGFPQAFVYLINSKKLDPEWSKSFSFYYSFLVGFSVLCIGTPAYLLELIDLKATAFGALIIASSATLLNGLYRAISLATKSIYIYNIISFASPVILCLICVIWKPLDYQNLAIGIVIAAVTNSFLSSIFLKIKIFFTENFKVNLIKIKKAVGYGFWSFIPTISIGLVTAFTYSNLRQGGTSEANAGYFSISLLFISFSTLPLSMITPVIFNSWSQQNNRESMLDTYVKLSHCGTLIALVCCGLGIFLVEPVTKVVFGEAFLASVSSTQALLVSLFAVYKSQLLSAALLAVGYPSKVAVGELVKATLIISIISLRFLHSATDAAIAWCLGEFCSMLYMSSVFHKNTNLPLLQVIGLHIPWLFKKINIKNDL